MSCVNCEALKRELAALKVREERAMGVVEAALNYIKDPNAGKIELYKFLDAAAELDALSDK